jgi:hypothetical protein
MADDVVDANAGKWFPDVQDLKEVNIWRLDVVTLLAVIGENSVAEHAQTITASIFCLLPRILPAPQALLKPSRPARMPDVPAKMSGVYSGTVLDSVGFFANIIQPLDDLGAFAFKAIEIGHKGDKERRRVAEEKKKQADASHGTKRPSSKDSGRSAKATGAANMVAFNIDTERGEQVPQPGLSRRRTMRDKLTDAAAFGTTDPNQRPAVPLKLVNPLHVLAVFSCLLSVALIGTAVKFHDGAAIVAVSMLSFASSVTGFASRWKPILMNLTHNNKVPKGDIVIRTREGAFVYIKCKESVTREIFSGTEECNYSVGGRIYRTLMAFGTGLLMVGVVLLGNCTWNMQLFVGASYISLNGLYWAMGMFGKHWFWDLSRYEWDDITPADACKADRVTEHEGMKGIPMHSPEDVPSFTRALWYAIRETKRIGWVERSGAAPGTEQWKKWLREAEGAARRGDRTWHAVKRKNEIMMEENEDAAPADSAEQHAPLSEVQGARRISVVHTTNSF